MLGLLEFLNTDLRVLIGAFPTKRPHQERDLVFGITKRNLETDHIRNDVIIECNSS